MNEPIGTFACPVCGRETPHYHDPELVNAARSRLAHEMALGEIAAEIVRTASPGHGESVFISRRLISRLAQLLDITPQRPDLYVRAVAPAGAEPSDVLRFSGDRFPLQTAEGRPKSVPWVMVAPHEQQAQANHGQSLKRLAERGGLGVDELWCVVHDQSWDRRPRPGYCDAWLSGINDLRIALVVAAQAARAAAPRGAGPEDRG